jgi:hypothetical protein
MMNDTLQVWRQDGSSVTRLPGDGFITLTMKLTMSFNNKFWMGKFLKRYPEFKIMMESRSLNQ